MQKKFDLKINENFVVRRPLYSFNSLSVINTLDFYENKNSFQENILTSSYSLHKSLNDCYTSIDKKIISLTKYKIRCAARTTPFGLNAGVGIGTFTSKISNSSIVPFKKHCQVDLEWLYSIIKMFELELGTALNITANNLIEIDKSHIRLNWGTALKQKEKTTNLIVIDKTAAVDIVLSHTIGKYISIADLLLIMIEKYPKVPIKYHQNLIQQLFENEILVSDLRCNLTVENQFDQFINMLNKYNYSSNLLIKLKKIQKDIIIYSNLEIGKGKNKYLDIVQDMKSIKEVSNYLRIDSYLNEKYTLSLDVMQDIKEIIEIILLLCNDYDKTLDDYYNKFISQFDSQFIPLRKVINDFNVGLPKKTDYKVSDYSEKAKIVLKSVLSQNDEIKQFKSEHINYLREQDVLVQNSTQEGEIGLFLFKDINNNIFYCLSPFIGSNKEFQSIGRFTQIKENKDTFSSKKENILNIEITCLPRSSKVANVLNCFSNNDLIFELGTLTLSQKKEKITIDDIYIQAKNGFFKFYSSRHKREVTFSISNKVNPSLLPPLVQFLLFSSNRKNRNIYDSIYLFRELTKYKLHTPRIMYKNFIFMPETWILDEFIFSGIKKFTEFKKVFFGYANKMKIPDIVFVQEGDNRLLLNFKDEHQLQIFFQLYQRTKSVYLVENIFENKMLIIKDDANNGYLGEYIFQYKNVNKEPLKIINCDTFTDISYCPLEKWVYFKLIIDKNLIGKILCKYLYPYLKKLINYKRIKKFFYVIYTEQQDQIRLRIELTDDSEVIFYVIDFLKKLIDYNLIYDFQIHSYVPEISRYGGNYCIDFAEKYFFINSVTAIKLRKIFEKKDQIFNEMIIFIIAVIKILTDLEISIEEQLLLFKYIDKNEYRNEFKKYRKELIELANSNHEWKNLRAYNLGYEVYQIMEFEKETLKNYWEQILILEKEKCLSSTKEEILLSIIHMFFNRLMGVSRERERKAMALIRHTLYALMKNYEKNNNFK